MKETPAPGAYQSDTFSKVGFRSSVVSSMPISARNNPLTEKKLKGPGPADYEAGFKTRKHPSWAFGNE